MPNKRRRVLFWRRGKPDPKYDIVRLLPENRPRGERFETLQDARAESERSEKLLRSFWRGSVIGGKNRAHNKFKQDFESSEMERPIIKAKLKDPPEQLSYILKFNTY